MLIYTCKMLFNIVYKCVTKNFHFYTCINIDKWTKKLIWNNEQTKQNSPFLKQNSIKNNLQTV